MTILAPAPAIRPESPRGSARRPYTSSSPSALAPSQVSQRHANSHAIVNGGFCATLDASHTVTSCKVVMGGVVASGLFVPSAAPEGPASC